MAKQIKADATYKFALKNWNAKVMGPKPTLEQFATAHALGCAAGKQALARAMELRECGATTGQVKMACILNWGDSGAHHNKRKELVKKRLITVAKDTSGTHTVYRIALTDRGRTLVSPQPAQDATPTQGVAVS